MLYLRKIEDYNYFTRAEDNATLADMIGPHLNLNKDIWFDYDENGYTDVLIIMNKSIGKTRGFPFRATFSHLY